MSPRALFSAEMAAERLSGRKRANFDIRAKDREVSR